MIRSFSLAIGSVLFLSACLNSFDSFFAEQDTAELYTDKAVLSNVFTTEVDLATAWTDDEFAVYTQALKFTFEEIGLKSSLDWTGPTPDFGGHIDVIAVTAEDSAQCKEFTQTLTYKEVEYKGHAKACATGSTWAVKKVK